MSALTQVLSRPLTEARPAQVGSIGLAFALEKLHLVQLEKRARGDIVLRARAAVPYQGSPEKLLSAPSTLRSVVRRALRADRFQGRTVVTALPPTDVRILTVTYQLAAEQTEDTAILKVMGSRVEGDLSEYVLDYMPVKASKGDEERLALVAVAHRIRPQPSPPPHPEANRRGKSRMKKNADRCSRPVAGLVFMCPCIVDHIREF